MFIYLFLRERERERERGSRRGRERIQRRLCSFSTEPDLGLELRNHKTKT